MRLPYWALICVAALLAPLAAVAAPLAPAPVMGAEQTQLNALVVQHQKLRSQLPADQRADLDRLTDRVRLSILGKTLRGDLLDTTKALLRAAAPGLTEAETGALAAYALDGIAAGDGQAQLLAATKQMQDMQMSFNLQYLQLQAKMQHENRTFTMLSNIMKTKHDTVKNSIGNIR
jgi:hypothetical protein